MRKNAGKSGCRNFFQPFVGMMSGNKLEKTAERCYCITWADRLCLIRGSLKTLNAFDIARDLTLTISSGKFYRTVVIYCYVQGTSIN